MFPHINTHPFRAFSDTDDDRLECDPQPVLANHFADPCEEGSCWNEGMDIWV